MKVGQHTNVTALDLCTVVTFSRTFKTSVLERPTFKILVYYNVKEFTNVYAIKLILKLLYIFFKYYSYY